MSVKILRPQCLPGICVNDMKDGQLAEILRWPTQPSRVGEAVQRHGKAANATLIPIGQPSENSWPQVFAERHETCRVRLLEATECIGVVEN